VYVAHLSVESFSQHRNVRSKVIYGGLSWIMTSV
jgi:hypothetical protein